MSTIRIPNTGRIVRATVPLADPIDLRSNRSPFTLRALDGRELQTQCEGVSWEPDGKASIVELLAIDPTPFSSYTVLDKPQSDRAPMLTPWARAMLATAPRLILGDGIDIQCVATNHEPCSVSQQLSSRRRNVASPTESISPGKYAMTLSPSSGSRSSAEIQGWLNVMACNADGCGGSLAGSLLAGSTTALNPSTVFGSKRHSDSTS
jgi:hypothetical protein